MEDVKAQEMDELKNHHVVNLIGVKAGDDWFSLGGIVYGIYSFGVYNLGYRLHHQDWWLVGSV